MRKDHVKIFEDGVLGIVRTGDKRAGHRVMHREFFVDPDETSKLGSKDTARGVNWQIGTAYVWFAPCDTKGEPIPYQVKETLRTPVYRPGPGQPKFIESVHTIDRKPRIINPHEQDGTPGCTCMELSAYRAKFMPKPTEETTTTEDSTPHRGRPRKDA